MSQTLVHPPASSNVFPSPTEEQDEMVRILIVLASSTRLSIPKLLHQHADQVCVRDLTNNFSLEQPTISHHLRLLRDANLISCRKHGLYAYYYIPKKSAARIQQILASLACLFQSSEEA